MKRIKLIILATIVISLSFCDTGYPLDEKESSARYLGKINPVLIDVQVTSRNLSQNLFTLETAIMKMQDYIDTVRSLTPPGPMIRAHKMILLSFKKLRMGFYLLSHGDREGSLGLVRSGRELLRTAVKDMVEFARSQGFIKEDK